MITEGSWKPKLKQNKCYICGKLFYCRTSKKHKSTDRIVRQSTAHTCSPKCSKIYQRLVRSNINNGIRQGYKKAIEEALEYISKRGFRECNYETNEIIKWLNKKNETNLQKM